VLNASGIKVNSTLVNAFAKALKDKNVTDFFGSVGGGSAPEAASTPAVATKAAEKKPEKK
jgi:ribosomal protein L12E/L44/L45/RPP1/RPP2